MINSLTKLTLTTTTLLGLTVIDTHLTRAAIIPYQFQVTIDSGTLAGQEFLGSFEVDNSLVTGAAGELVPVASLEFNYLGSTFTEDDAAPSSMAEAFFVEGQFLGLSFVVEEPDFSFVPGFFELNEAFFAYTSSDGTPGFADLEYTVIPESQPVTFLGATTVIGLGLVLRKKSRN